MRRKEGRLFRPPVRGWEKDGRFVRFLLDSRFFRIHFSLPVIIPPTDSAMSSYKDAVTLRLDRDKIKFVIPQC